MISYSMIRMSAGQTFPCPAIVHFFNTNGDEFRIYFAPNWTQPPTPETTFVEVTCNAVASDGCNDWYVDPVPAGSDAGAIRSRAQQPAAWWARPSPVMEKHPMVATRAIIISGSIFI